MKAILKVSNFNKQFCNLNGLTFEVVDLAKETATLNIKGVHHIFKHKEIIIVDLQSEYDIAYENLITNIQGDNTIYHSLVNYVEKNGISCAYSQYI